MRTAVDEVTGPDFEAAVRAIPSVKDGYRKGLQAMRADSRHVSVSDTRLLEGSVDIDSTLEKDCPEAPRWDYAIGYGGKVYFVEVHPACTSNVAEVVSKVGWLKSWLGGQGKPLAELWDGEWLYWVASGKVAISKTSPQYRRLSLAKVKLTGSPFRLQ